MLAGRRRAVAVSKPPIVEKLKVRDRADMPRVSSEIAGDASALREPTGDELKAGFEKGSEGFALPSRASFHQLYFLRNGVRAETPPARKSS